MGEDLIPLPKPRKLAGGSKGGQRKADKLRNLEVAAEAAVRMENNEYTRPGYTRLYLRDEQGEYVLDENGRKVPTWNKSELMRIAGYSNNATDHNERLLEDPYFLHMLELHRMRRSDPTFRKGFSDDLLKLIADNATAAILEDLIYAPHQLTFDQKLRALKSVLDAGLKVQKLSKGGLTKSEKLLEGLAPEERDAVMDDYEASLERELEEVKARRMAHKGADYEAEADEL